MIVGVPREIKDNEYRVAMTPGGARQLVEAGHEVWVETSAGEGSGFPDAQYQKAGAKIVPTNADAWSAQHRSVGAGFRARAGFGGQRGADADCGCPSTC